MLASPHTRLPARLRRARRVGVPLLLTGGLVASVLAAVVPASADGNGTFTIGDTAVALNQASDPGLGNIAPAADAAQNGMFGPQLAWPVIPLHAALSRNGHVISFGSPVNVAEQGGLAYDDWDLSAGTDLAAHTDSDTIDGYNSFCNSLVELADGRLLMVGGQSTMSTMLYDPASHAEVMGQPLNTQRWYGTSLRLTDGRIIVLGGGPAGANGAYTNPDDSTILATTPEIGNGVDGWGQLTGATNADIFGARDNHWWYPRAFNGPNGGVVGMSGDQLWSLSADGNGSTQETGTLPFNPRVSGSQVMFAPGQVLVAGGGQDTNANPDLTVGTNEAAVVDFNGGQPAVASTNPMQFGRNWLNLTVLPTGEVLANGGTHVGTEAGDDNSMKQAEIWNPGTGAWRSVASAQRTRTYHSTALLLPSGAVFTGGGGVPGPEDNFNAEIYYPSYLFTTAADGSVQWASRPAITSIAGSATYGGTVQLGLGDGREIASASVISSPSVTHSQDTDQRRIPLQITRNGDTLSATLPGSMNTMPAGDYELSVVDANGVPSAAQMITITRDGAGSVTVAPGAAPVNGEAATGGQPADGGTAPVAPAPVNPPPATVVAPGGTATAPEGTVPLAVDQAVGLESSRAGYRVEHDGSRIVLRKPAGKSTKARRDESSWIVRTGLASSHGVSFESVDKPGSYLAAPAKGSGSVGLVANDGTAKFASRATFEVVKGVAGRDTSFRVWGERKLLLAADGSHLVARTAGSSKQAKADSTFGVRAAFSTAPAVPLSSGRSIGLEATDHRGYRLRLDGKAVALRKVGSSSSSTLKHETSWIVRTDVGAKHGVEFESVEKPGWFLAAPTHGAGALVLAKRSGSKAFAARVTFSRVSGVAGRNASLRLTAQPKLYLRTEHQRFFVESLDRSAEGRAAATFFVRSGLSPAPTR